MAGVAIELTIDGIDSAQERLARLDLTDAEFRPLLSDIGEEVVLQTHERFEAGEDPADEPWEPSARVEAEGGQTLVDKARLQNSIGYQVDGDQVETGTNAIYAAIHQFGGEDVAMPQIVERAYLPRTIDEIGGLGAIINDFITGALGV